MKNSFKTGALGIYIHWPFCLNKCPYCDFNSHVRKNVKQDFTFLNIISKKNLKLRLKKRKRKNRYDNFNYLFYNKVQKGYLKLSKNKKKYFIVDSNKKINENMHLIIKQVKKLI